MIEKRGAQNTLLTLHIQAVQVLDPDLVPALLQGPDQDQTLSFDRE